MAQRTIVEILLQAKDATGRAFGAVGGRLRSLKDSIFSLRTAAAAFVAFVTTRVVGQVVKAFADQERAIIRLNTALRVTGRFTEDGTRKIQGMANEMQRLTTVSDEAALGISATLAQLATGLTTDQLAEAQKSVIGLSEAFGIDLQSAAQLVGKTLSGEMNALGRYGIRIDETGNQQQKFNQIVAQTAGFFDVAVGSTQSLIGQFAQAKNAAGEMLETFGQVLAETFKLNTSQGTLRDRLNELNERIRANLPEWVKWGQVVVAVLSAVVVSLAAVVRGFFNMGQVIGRVITLSIDLFDDFVKALFNIGQLLVDLMEMKSNPVAGLAHLKRDLQDLRDAGRGMGEAFTTAWAAAVGDVKDVNAAIASVGTAWSNVVAAINAEPLPIKDTATAGGGKNRALSPQQVAAEQAKTRLGEANQALSRFAAGTMSTGAFESEMSRLVPQLQGLRDSGLLSQDQWAAVTAAIAKFREEAEAAGVLITSLDDTASATFGQALAQQIREAQEALGTLNESLAATAVDGIGSFMSASVEAFGLFAEGSKQAGRAFEGAMLMALASVASSFAQMFAARATAAIAEAILPSSVLTGQSAGGLAAAGYFTAAALAMSALSGALRGAANRTSGGATGGGSAGAQERTEAASREREKGTIHVTGEWWPGDPAFVDKLAIAVNEMLERGVGHVEITHD